MGELVVVRRGQGSIHMDSYDCLSPLGRRQAAVLGDYFRSLAMRFHGVYSGALERQRRDHAAELAGPQCVRFPL
jgi:broad specificity phosphatase PhoE